MTVVPKLRGLDGIKQVVKSDEGDQIVIHHQQSEIVDYSFDANC